MGQIIGQRLGNSVADEQSGRYQIESIFGRQRGRRTSLAKAIAYLALSSTQFTNVPLRAVPILPDSASSHAIFMFLEEQTVRRSSFKIAGNRRRLKSLLRYINQ